MTSKKPDLSVKSNPVSAEHLHCEGKLINAGCHLDVMRRNIRQQQG